MWWPSILLRRWCITNRSASSISYVLQGDVDVVLRVCRIALYVADICVPQHRRSTLHGVIYSMSSATCPSERSKIGLKSCTWCGQESGGCERKRPQVHRHTASQRRTASKRCTRRTRCECGVALRVCAPERRSRTFRERALSGSPSHHCAHAQRVCQAPVCSRDG